MKWLSLLIFVFAGIVLWFKLMSGLLKTGNTIAPYFGLLVLAGFIYIVYRSASKEWNRQ